MDTQTRRALKKDSFVEATTSGVNWLSENRASLVKLIVIVAVVLVLAGGSLGFWMWSSNAANVALSAAMDTYIADIVPPGAPVTKGTFATAADRSKAANQQFVQVANKYGWLPEGSKAHYFAGVTFLDLGQNASAESELKTAAKSMNRNLANLAKLALAGLYHRTGRDAEAIKLYNELIASPSTTVPATLAQLDLADLYAGSGDQNQARALWAKVKDADKEGAAGSIAAQKLDAKQ